MSDDQDIPATAHGSVNRNALAIWHALHEPIGHQHRLAVLAERAGTTVGVVRKYVRDWGAAGYVQVQPGVARLPKGARGVPPNVWYDCGGCYLYIGYLDEDEYTTVDRCQDARNPRVTRRHRGIAGPEGEVTLPGKRPGETLADYYAQGRADTASAALRRSVAIATTPDPSAFASARAALAEARTVVEAKDVHDKAAGLKEFARLAGDRSLEIEAAEIRNRAARRLGEMLAASDRARGALQRGQIPAVPNRNHGKPTLAELGVSKKLSSYAQKLAALPEAQFEELMRCWRAKFDGSTERITTSLAKEIGRQHRDKGLGDPPSLPEGKYRAIYADPPWEFRGGKDRGAHNHYPTMTENELCDLPVGDLALDEGAALLLWCPCSQVETAIHVMTAWGFRFVTVPFVWAKQLGDEHRIGMGFWTRMQAELVLLGTRGRVSRRDDATDIRQIVSAPVGAHSQKPERLYQLIEALLNGPYIELFARGAARPGWDTWGREAQK